MNIPDNQEDKEKEKEIVIEVDTPDITKFAGFKEVKKWFYLSAVITAIMIIGVVVSATLLPGDPQDGSRSQLLGEYSIHYDYSDILSPFEVKAYAVSTIFARNLLVLALHFFCCLVGAIIGREAYVKMKRKAEQGEEPNSHPDSIEEVTIEREDEDKPSMSKKTVLLIEKWNQLPKWVADLSLAYAATATLASIAVQTTGLGFVLADISARSGLSPLELGILILPHAPLELIGVFLPLGLFLIQAKKHELAPLGKWSVQSLLIGLPIIFVAALLEVFVTPGLVSQAITNNDGLPDTYYSSP